MEVDTSDESKIQNPKSKILLYDGVCGFCNRIVRFVLKWDKKDRFRFASLQSAFGRELLVKHGKNPDDLNTMYVVLDYQQPGELLIARGRAAVMALNELGSVWKVFGTVLSILPNFLLNFGYNLIANNRYRLFGKFDSCPLPSPQQRQKFIEV